MSTETEYEPVEVRLDPRSLDALAGIRPRMRRALKTNTFTLTAAVPYARVLPQADSRCEAYITAATEASPPVIFIATNQADAANQGGGAAQIAGTDPPIPVNTTDAVWVSAATGFPVTVSVWAIYEEPE